MRRCLEKTALLFPLEEMVVVVDEEPSETIHLALIELCKL